jgi:hypothetical protein
MSRPAPPSHSHTYEHPEYIHPLERKRANSVPIATAHADPSLGMHQQVDDDDGDDNPRR